MLQGLGQPPLGSTLTPTAAAAQRSAYCALSQAQTPMLMSTAASSPAAATQS
jgi:hypothetical protein